MYNKLFAKILDSSIWLESDTTRIVWLTLIASMNEDGFCQFAAIGNLAQRAIVPLEKCKEAVRILESPDTESGDDANEGRRIERVPGGWMVLNATKYRDMVTREIVKEQTRNRVANHRAKKKGDNAPVTVSNAPVTVSNAPVKNVTQSDTDTDTETDKKTKEGKHPPRVTANSDAVTRNGKLSDNVLAIKIEKFWKEFDSLALDPNKHPDADEWFRLALAGSRVGLTRTQVKEHILRSHPRYGGWPFTEQFDSQQEITFPEAAKEWKCTWCGHSNAGARKQCQSCRQAKGASNDSQASST
jgi:hypothetical protein